MGCHVSKESKEIISEDAQKEASNTNKDLNSTKNEENAKGAAEITQNDVKTIHESERTVTNSADDKPLESNHAAPEVDIDLADPEVMKAATKIQATFRGHMARKEAPKDEKKSPEPEPAQEEEKKAEEEEEPIDLDDPDLAKAATKIQATFRGHRARSNKDQEA